MNRYLVTGADGFVGSHFVEHLLSRGHQVRALAQYNSFNSWGWLEKISASPLLEVRTGDIRDPFFCVDLTKDIDVVVHLAALIAIPFSYSAPSSYIETNVNGTLNLCQASLKSGIKRFVHTSTSEVYGTAVSVPMNEQHPIQTQSPYSASKSAADHLAVSHWYSFGLPVVIARPFNIFGPRQSARAVISTIISQMLAGKKEIELGDLRPTRDFNFVTNACNAFYRIAESTEYLGDTFNFGSGSDISIGQLFEKLRDMTGAECIVKVAAERIRPEKSEVLRLLCDNTKIKEKLGYEPQISFDEGLQFTIDWFRTEADQGLYKTHVYNV